MSVKEAAGVQRTRKRGRSNSEDEWITYSELRKKKIKANPEYVAKVESADASEKRALDNYDASMRKPTFDIPTKTYPVHTDQPTFQNFLFEQLINYLRGNLEFIGSIDLFSIVCKLVVIAHGGPTPFGTDETQTSLLTDLPIIKYDLNPKGCPGYSFEIERLMLMLAFNDKLFKGINKVTEILRPEVIMLELQAEINKKIKKDLWLQEYLAETSDIITKDLEGQKMSPDGYAAPDLIDRSFARLSPVVIDRIPSAITHLSDRSYGFEDEGNYTSFIMIEFYYINSQGELKQLTKNLILPFNSHGIYQGDNSTGEHFNTIYLSDIIIPIKKFLAWFFGILGLDQADIDRLIANFILIMFDTSCSGGATSLCGKVTCAGGKTKKPKNQKTKKPKNQKTKKTKNKKTKNKSINKYKYK